MKFKEVVDRRKYKTIKSVLSFHSCGLTLDKRHSDESRMSVTIMSYKVLLPVIKLQWDPPTVR